MIRKVDVRFSFASLRVRAVLLALLGVLPWSAFALNIGTEASRAGSDGRGSGPSGQSLFWFAIFPLMVFLALWLGTELLILRRIKLLLKGADYLVQGKVR